jgi:hypothetical protein
LNAELARCTIIYTVSMRGLKRQDDKADLGICASVANIPDVDIQVLADALQIVVDIWVPAPGQGTKKLRGLDDEYACRGHRLWELKDDIR